MSLREQAIEVLNKRYMDNYCILEMFKQYGRPEIYIENDSVLIRQPEGDHNFVMMSFENQEDGKKLLGHMTETDKRFYNVGTWPLQLQKAETNDLHLSMCIQYYLPDHVKLEGDTTGVIPLDPDWAGYIHHHYTYKQVISEAYIRDRIKVGHAFGIMEDGKLVAWAMTHEEGTIGILHVLEDYRRKGYAQKINVKLVESLRSAGLPCLSHIVHENLASTNMSLKNGFVPGCEIQWGVLK